MKNENTAVNKPANNLFNQDFFQKLILLIITFTLTGVLGALLSYYFQTRTSYTNYQQSLIESERKVAKEIFTETTNGMDSRIYFAQIVNDDLSLKSKTFGAKWTEYIKELTKWNTTITTRQQLMDLYFGEACLSNFKQIHIKFIALNLRLQQVRRIREGATTNMSDQEIDNLKKSIGNDIGTVNKRIAQLSYLMITKIQGDSVGRVPTLKEYNFKDYILD